MSGNTRLERCYNASGYDLPATTRSYNCPVLLSPTSLDHSLDMTLTEPGTWSHATSDLNVRGRSQLLDSHDRFKPEKSQRRPVQKMKWNQSRWSRTLAGDLFSCSLRSPGIPCESYPNNFAPVVMPALPVESESRVSSMTIADVSPRIAVKKVLLLYEHAQYHEAASFIERLSAGTFRIILRELPMDVFVEALPHSLPIMEALYAKVFASDGPSMNLKPLKPESVVMHMVKFFSREDLAQGRNRREALGRLTLGCKKILEVIVLADGKMIKTVVQRQRAVNKAVEGMGQHGLVGTTDESLLPLHDALKLEFRRVVDTYKGALQKLEDLALSNRNHPKSVAHGPAPIQASHQRQLSLRAEEIQDRLIKNKSLLNVVEPTLDNHCLDILLGILARRIECDKEALFQFTQLRKEAGDITNETVIAPLLMRYSRGCKQVLELMREAAKDVGGDVEDYEDDSSDLSGYHSDSDSAIMTSGNSPYVTPRARYNFLSRSVRSKAVLRPSVLSSSSSNSGLSSSRSGFMDVGGSAEAGELHSVHSGSTTTSNTPTRPRHIKLKNQLHKNNSLVSSSSLAGSESSGSVGTASVAELGGLTSALNCVDCVTVVSVPDDQVISQGLNHRCAINSRGSSVGEVSDFAPNPTQERLITELRNEINQLRRGMHNANATIHLLEQREKNLLTCARLTEEVSLRDPEERASQLIREYGAVYAQPRVEAMDALDSLPQLATADELKSKLLFSVLVLAFRAVQTNLAEIKGQVEAVLQMNVPQKIGQERVGGGKEAWASSQVFDPVQARLMESVGSYMLSAQHRFDLSRPVQQVANQLWSTLYDYPCLKKCEGLLKYIETCVQLAWGLCNLTPACVLEYETRVFMREMHVRFHSSDQSSDTIKTYLWPALLKGPDGPCLHKGVVIT